MADLEAVRQAIIARLEDVPDIGRIYPYQPYLRSEQALRELYVTDGLLLGWFVRRVATRESAPSIGRWVETHTWLIWGVMAIGTDGASETAFDAMIEAIRGAFREDQTLGDVVANTATSEVAGIQVENAEPVLFCGVLCHSVRLLLHTVCYR
ncbi:MAG: hypothetical protein H7838_07450 [Magnetococcus sp. DMHC-8]